MKKNGYIKLHRKEFEWLKPLKPPEYQLYITARVFAIWGKANKRFGMFEGRMIDIEENMFPTWSTGKIQATLKGLVNKGYVQKKDRSYYYITNFPILIGKGKKFENIIQESEINLLNTEIDFQNIEKKITSIEELKKQIADNKNINLK